MQTRTLNDRYRLDEPVGEGGMAVVYRGYDLVLNRDVAVKLLRDQYGSDNSFLARFDREAQSAARLSHPNIANVYDVGQDGDIRYIVMEHVEGANLKDLIRRQGPFTVEGAAFVIRQIAEGLDYAHARGLIHRDIKPQNILVNDDGNVKVVDFGIAKGLSDSSLTDTGIGMGTVHYVSPEQARGEQATPLSDVYSTGVVLYEMLTQNVPFEADSPVGVAMQHVNSDPPPPSQLNPHLPPEVDQFLAKALAKDPAERFRSAGDMADALEALVRGEPVATTGATQMMAGGAAAAGAPPAARGPRRRGDGRGDSGDRTDNFRDDVGCVTWLIGSAILIGLVGLVILAFQLGDFGLFEPTGDDDENDSTPTATSEAEPSPTEEPTATPEATATPEPTEEETPTPSPSPTPEEEELILVPELVGGTLEQAEIALPDGLQLQVEEVFSDEYAPGEIAYQDPPPESEVEPGSTVYVQVSRGSETVEVPNLAGEPSSSVFSQLSDLPVDLEGVEEPSQDVPEGNVIRIEPTGDVTRGSTVTVVVSAGDVVQVPDVYQTPVQQAVMELQNAGLEVGSVSPQSCDFIQSQNSNFDCESFPDGGVVSGTLGWNEFVERGSTIDIAYYNPEDD